MEFNLEESLNLNYKPTHVIKWAQGDFEEQSAC